MSLRSLSLESLIHLVEEHPEMKDEVLEKAPFPVNVELERYFEIISKLEHFFSRVNFHILFFSDIEDEYHYFTQIPYRLNTIVPEIDCFHDQNLMIKKVKQQAKSFYNTAKDISNKLTFQDKNLLYFMTTYSKIGDTNETWSIPIKYYTLKKQGCYPNRGNEKGSEIYDFFIETFDDQKDYMTKLYRSLLYNDEIIRLLCKCDISIYLNIMLTYLMFDIFLPDYQPIENPPIQEGDYSSEDENEEFEDEEESD